MCAAHMPCCSLSCARLIAKCHRQNARVQARRCHWSKITRSARTRGSFSALFAPSPSSTPPVARRTWLPVTELDRNEGKMSTLRHTPMANVESVDHSRVLSSPWVSKDNGDADKPARSGCGGGTMSSSLVRNCIISPNTNIPVHPQSATQHCDAVLGPPSETTAPPCRASFASVDILPARFDSIRGRRNVRIGSPTQVNEY